METFDWHPPKTHFKREKMFEGGVIGKHCNNKHQQIFPLFVALLQETWK